MRIFVYIFASTLSHIIIVSFCKICLTSVKLAKRRWEDGEHQSQQDSFPRDDSYSTNLYKLLDGAIFTAPLSFKRYMTVLEIKSV